MVSGGEDEDKAVRGETVEIKVMCMRLKNSLCNSHVFFFPPRSACDDVLSYLLREIHKQCASFVSAFFHHRSA